jgi:hypothetical protein
MQGRFGRMHGPGGPPADFHRGHEGPGHGKHARARKHDRACEHHCERCQAKAKKKHKGKERHRAAAQKRRPDRPADMNAARRLHMENARLKKELAQLRAELAKIKKYLHERAD